MENRDCLRKNSSELDFSVQEIDLGRTMKEPSPRGFEPILSKQERMPCEKAEKSLKSKEDNESILEKEREEDSGETDSDASDSVDEGEEQVEQKVQDDKNNKLSTNLSSQDKQNSAVPGIPFHFLNII